jgi:hypothetical protein
MAKTKRRRRTGPDATRPGVAGSAGAPTPRGLPPRAAGLGAFIARHSLAVFLGVVTVTTFAVLEDFLLFRHVYLFKDIGSDSINWTYPTIFHIVEYLHTVGIPRWSFSQGMGQNLFGAVTFDPFLILFYLVGAPNVAYTLAYVEAAKIIGGGLFFFLFLRTQSLSSAAALLGGLLYSFTAYMVVGGGWYWFSYDALCIALLLLAFERKQVVSRRDVLGKCRSESQSRCCTRTEP